MSDVNPIGGSGSDEGRDSACTPKWLADLIGRVDLDPCSNPRSHINAAQALSLERGDNGLVDVPGSQSDWSPGCYYMATLTSGRLARAKHYTRTFINPPYARGQVIRWVRHWRHTNFIFLLRWDPRTKWFRELLPHCTHVWFPLEVEGHPGRIEFEPPPGVKFSSNPLPHALYLRHPSAELKGRLMKHGLLLDVSNPVPYGANDGQDQRGNGTGGADDDGAGGAEPPGGAASAAPDGGNDGWAGSKTRQVGY